MAWWKVFLWRFMEPLSLQVFPQTENDDGVGELQVVKGSDFEEGYGEFFI